MNPWDNGSELYRRTLLTGTGLILLGIVLAVLGAVLHALPVQWTAIGVIGLGLVTHLAAQLVRARDARRRHRGATDARR
jgi:threonine/homoserine/homoserine lactone efflux protein